MVKHLNKKVEERHLEKTKMDHYRNVSNRETVGSKTKAESRLLPRKTASVISPGPHTDIPDDKKTYPRACSPFQFLSEPDVRRSDQNSLVRRPRRHLNCLDYRFSTPPAHDLHYSASGIEVMVPVTERYQTVCGDHSKRLSYISQRYDDHLSYKMLTLREEATV